MRPLASRIPALLRERAFRRYWTAQSVSLIGDQISLIAIPLVAVLALGADAAEMGLLKTAELLPALLLSLPAGAWIDRRVRRRRIMIAADLLRALLIVSLALAYAVGALTLAQLYAVAFMVGGCTVLFEICNATLFVSLVPKSRFVAGNSLLNGSRAMAFVSGPGAGGLLVQLLAAPVALLADALTFLYSGALLARIAPTEPPPAPSAKGYVTEGLRWALRHPTMRAMFAASGTVQFFNLMFHTLFVLYATTELGLSAGLLRTVWGVARSADSSVRRPRDEWCTVSASVRPSSSATPPSPCRSCSSRWPPVPLHWSSLCSSSPNSSPASV